LNTINAMTRVAALPGCLALLLLGSGCFVEFDSGIPIWEEDRPTPRESSTYEPEERYASVSVRRGALYGYIGSVAHLEGEASWSYASWNYGDLSVEITVERDGEAAMAIINIEDFDEMQTGVEVRNDSRVDIIGCSGPEPGNWTYDEYASDVTVRTERDPYDPDVVHVHFSGSVHVSVGDGAMSISGSFTLSIT